MRDGRPTPPSGNGEEAAPHGPTLRRPHTRAGPGPASHRHRGGARAIMSILDTTIVAVALDTLGRDFKVPISTIQWVTTGYLLALAVVIPITGWAMDRFGAKPMWLLSLALFVVGSSLCGLAWSATCLIVFRIPQGLGGGMILPIGQAMLARAAGPAAHGPGHERHRGADRHRPGARTGPRRAHRLQLLAGGGSST